VFDEGAGAQSAVITGRRVRVVDAPGVTHLTYRVVK